MKTSKKLAQKSTPLLSIVIPIFNSKRHYQDCLQSILNSAYRNYEVILVDDGSNDGSLEEIERIALAHPKIRIIKTLTRRGIPRSRNTGIELARGEYIALLDIDMELGKGWPEDIIKILVDHQDIGGVLPKVIDFQKRDTLQAVGIYIIPHTCWAIPRGFGEKDQGQYDSECDIGIGAAGSIIRKKALQDIGGFDETLGMFDDIDMGWRIRLQGWRTFYTYKAIMYHWTSKPWAVRPKTSSLIEYEFYIDNLIRPLIKNLEFKNLLRYLSQALIIMFARVIQGLIQGNTIPLRGSLKALYWNLTNLDETLKLRRRVQSLRKVNDQSLFGQHFVEGTFIGIYFKYLKKIFETAKIWYTTDSAKDHQPS